MLHLLQLLLCFIIWYILLILHASSSLLFAFASAFNGELQVKHATLLSCDTISCKGGHLEGKKEEEKE